MHLSEKEKLLLKDLMSEEELCVQKYQKGSEQAKDPGLKNLFSAIGKVEQTHYDTLNAIDQGNTPNTSSGGGQKPTAPTTPATNISEQDKQCDKYLCSDALETEKHVSSTYNTSIFEFSQPEFRNTLNHLQKEEQEHGEELYKYMTVNGMYQQ